MTVARATASAAAETRFPDLAVERREAAGRLAHYKREARERLAACGPAELRVYLRGTFDTGRSSLVVSEQTLAGLAVALFRLARLRVKLVPFFRRFRFANGSTTTSCLQALLPVGLGGQHGVLKIAVVLGGTLLLI